MTIDKEKKERKNRRIKGGKAKTTRRGGEREEGGEIEGEVYLIG